MKLSKIFLILIFTLVFSIHTTNLNLSKIENLKNVFFSSCSGMSASALPILACAGLSKYTKDEAFITTIGAGLWLSYLYAMKRLLGNKCQDLVLVSSSLISMYLIGNEIVKRKKDDE